MSDETHDDPEDDTDEFESFVRQDLDQLYEMLRTLMSRVAYLEKVLSRGRVRDYGSRTVEVNK